MTTLAALYNAAEIILWVEDLVTAAYLGACWGHDARFKLYIGGGHENLAAVVEDARCSGRRGVFGLRDRDFGPTNRTRWGDPNVRNFALESFEIECFLLDPVALATCALNTARRSEAQIRDRLYGKASELLWWMACRRTIAGLREARQANFPSHPTRTAVASREAALAVVTNNKWVRATVPGLGPLVAPERLAAALDDAYAEYARHVEDGTWVGVISGKELVAELVGWIYTRNLSPGSSGIEDLAKAVAAEQIRSQRVPAEVLELHAALIARRTD